MVNESYQQAEQREITEAIDRWEHSGTASPYDFEPDEE